MATLGQLVVEFRAETAAFRRELGNVRNDTRRTADSMSNIARSARTMVGGLAGFATVTTFVRSFVTEVTAGERAAGKLEGVLRATGYAARLTADDINSLAGEIERRSLFDDDEIKDAAAVLATFRNIQGQTFREGLKMAADMSTVMGTGLRESVVQLGKALNEPTRGIVALRRVGVSFTETQTRMIAQMEKQGDVAGAQRVVLQELAAEFGGAAASSNRGLVGAIHNASTAWGDFVKSLATPRDGILGWVQDAVNGVAATIRKLTPDAQDNINRFMAEREKLQNQLDTGASFEAPSAPGGAPLIRQLTKGDRDRIQGEIDLLNQKIQAQKDWISWINGGQAAAEAAAAAGRQQTEDELADAEKRQAALQKMIDLLKEQKAIQGMDSGAQARRHAAQLGASEAQQEWIEWETRRQEFAKTIAQDVAKIDPIKIDLSGGPKGRSAQLIKALNQQTLNDAVAYENSLKAYFAADRERQEAEQQMIEDAKRRAEQWEDAWTRAVQGTGDAFALFFERVGEDGLSSFRDLLQNIVGMWQRSMAQLAGDSIAQWLVGVIGGAVGGKAIGGGGAPTELSTEVGVFHRGGVAGSPSVTRSVAVAAFDGAPRHHRGGIAGLSADEVPAILQRGERILPRDQASSTGPTPKAAQEVITIHFAYNPTVQAIDTRTAVDLLEQHGDVIANRVVRALGQSRGLRQKLGTG